MNKKTREGKKDYCKTPECPYEYEESKRTARNVFFSTVKIVLTKLPKSSIIWLVTTNHMRKRMGKCF